MCVLLFPISPCGEHDSLDLNDYGNREPLSERAAEQDLHLP